MLSCPERFIELKTYIESKLSYLKELEPQFLIESLKRRVGKDMWSPKEGDKVWDSLWNSIKIISQ